MVERHTRRVRGGEVERGIALLGHVELGPEREPQALEGSEPREELLLGQRLGVGGSLQFLERPQLAVAQRRADEAGVLRVRGVVLDERKRR